MKVLGIEKCYLLLTYFNLENFHIRVIFMRVAIFRQFDFKLIGCMANTKIY